MANQTTLATSSYGGNGLGVLFCVAKYRPMRRLPFSATGEPCDPFKLDTRKGLDAAGVIEGSEFSIEVLSQGAPLATDAGEG